MNMDQMHQQPLVDGIGKGTQQVRWTNEMDRLMIDVLMEQLARGNKGDNGWKPVAYQAVRGKVKEAVDINITVSNIRNRLKTWRTHHLAVQELVKLSGFGICPLTHTLKADDSVWSDYLKEHPQAIKYRSMNLTNWDEIASLIGTEQATGTFSMTPGQAEVDISDVPDTPISGPSIEEVGIDDVTSDSPAPTPHSDCPTSQVQVGEKRKRNRRDNVEKESSMMELTTSFKTIADHIAERYKKPDPGELLTSLRKLSHIDATLRVKLVEALGQNDTMTKIFFMMDEVEQLEWCKIRFGP